jgi:NADH-quinone oxidoreductase subunit L
MTLPLVILAALSIVAGFVIIPAISEALGLPGGFGEIVYEVGHPEEFSFNVALATISTLAGVAGLLLGVYLYRRPGRVQRIAANLPELTLLVQNKFYFDELYQAIVDRVILVFARLTSWFDRKIVNDTGVDGPSFLTNYFGSRLKLFQTGKIPNYAMFIIAGLIVLVVVAYSTRT